MQNNRGNMRVNDKRMKYRKRNRSISGQFLFAITVILVIFVFSIRDIKAELKEIQVMLKRVEVLQYGRNETEHKEEASAIEGELDYIGSIGSVDVEKPVQRTKEEAIQRLGVLGQSDSVIEEIHKNSSTYPESMLIALANNPEMADFVAGYIDGGGAAPGGLTNAEKEQDYPLLLQWDPRWGYEEYGNGSNIGLTGCGPTCLSMVLYYLTKDEVLTPDRIAAYSMENGYYVSGSGTAWALMEDMPKLYDIQVTKPRVTERALKTLLDQGRIIICAMGAGDFTLSGHFIVIYGYGEQGFMINDPNCIARSRRIWTFKELEPQIKNIWSYGK